MKGSCDPLLKKSAKKMAKERRHHHMARPDESNREEQVVTWKRRKGEKRKKKVEGVTVDAGSSKVELVEVDNRREREKKKKRKLAEEEQAVRKSKRSKPDDEVVGLTPVDAGKRSKKVVRWRLRRKLLQCLRGREVMGHFAVVTPPVDPKVPGLFFDQQLREEIISEFYENKEFDSYLLFQYRTNGYAEIREEVSDEGEGDDYQIRYFVSDYESEDETKIKDKNKDKEQSSIDKNKDQEQSFIAEGKDKNKIRSAAKGKGKDKNKIKSRAPLTM